MGAFVTSLKSNFISMIYSHIKAIIYPLGIMKVKNNTVTNNDNKADENGIDKLKDLENEDVEYRIGTLEDLNDIMRIDYETFKDGEVYSYYIWNMLLQDKTFFVAIKDKQIVGYNVCADLPQYLPTEIKNFVKENNIPILIIIMSFSVSEKMRGKGVGNGLMKIMLNYFQHKAPISIGLQVRKSNTPALNLYAKHGFIRHDIELHEYYKGTNPENGLFMYKYLV